MPLGFQVAGLGVVLASRTDRPVSATNPRKARAAAWLEHPTQKPATLTEPTVKKRRRENLVLLFKAIQQLFYEHASYETGTRDSKEKAPRLACLNRIGAGECPHQPEPFAARYD